MSGKRFMNNLIREAILNIHTILICKVDSYASGIANVTPIFTDNEGETYSQIINVRAMKQKTESGQVIIPLYEPGDMVVVGVTERSLDGVSEPFDLSSSIILGLY